jgi:hypothetical protein
MTSRLAKSIATLAAVAALAGASHAPVLSPLMLTVSAAQAGQGADDLVGEYTQPAGVAIAPRTTAKKDDRIRHRHHRGHKAVRRADDAPNHR